MILRAMFRSPQPVDGERRTQAEIDLDRVVLYQGPRLIANVPATELMVLTSEDLPSGVIDAIRVTLPNAYQPWTEAEETALRDMWARGVPIADMVTALGRRYKAVQSRARRLGLPPRRG